jgi:hypothetical protein
LLLTGSGLLVDALRRQQGSDLGFDSKHVLTAEIIARTARYRDPAQASLLVDQLLARLGAMPGVEAASAVNWPPMTNDTSISFLIEGETRADAALLPTAGYRVATPDYARAMNIPVTTRARRKQP